MQRPSPAEKAGGGVSPEAPRDRGAVAALLIVFVSIPLMAGLSYLAVCSGIDAHWGVGLVAAAGIVLLGLAAYTGKRSSGERVVFELAQGIMLLVTFFAMLPVSMKTLDHRLTGVIVLLVATLALFVALLVFYLRFHPRHAPEPPAAPPAGTDTGLKWSTKTPPSGKTGSTGVWEVQPPPQC